MTIRTALVTARSVPTHEFNSSLEPLIGIEGAMRMELVEDGGVGKAE